MFDSLRGMAGMAGLMKDLPRIKAKLEQVKEEVGGREVEASSGGGAVTAVANGKLRIVQIRFDQALLGLRVERRSGLVKQKYPWAFEDGPSDRYALFLSPGQFQATFPNLRLVAVGRVLNEVTDRGKLGRLDHLFLGCAGSAIGDVVVYSIVKQHRVLRDDADSGANAILGDIANILTVDPNCPSLNVVESE